ncbi:MAG: hypothetical protein COB56_05905 [Robiginitomaculum sp.]|nr:MAG: hypothetical protein COB56_05905 [Robiginitomaculum sp.]
MILRSLTKHVNDQNWFAVAIDFFIVVMGVFIGLQVANWSAGRANHKNYLLTLDRFRLEIAENLAIIDEQDQAMNDALATGRSGLDALLSCVEGPEAIETVNAGIAQLRGTHGIQLRATALMELTSNSILLSEQSDSERKRFANLRYFLELAQDITIRFEPGPLDTSLGTSILRIEPAESLKNSYFGIDYKIPRYPLVLNANMKKACTNIELQRWFHNWEVWQSNVVIFNIKLRHEYQETHTLLQERKK